MTLSAKSPSLHVLYASQTGNAEYIAKNIAAEATKRGFSTTCLVMDHIEQVRRSNNLIQVELAHIRVAVFVSSTTGDGDSPDNALKFWRWVRKAAKTASGPLFAHTRFTVLGLGDTNYSNFGAHPIKIEKKLTEMGASVIYPRAIADEVEGCACGGR